MQRCAFTVCLIANRYQRNNRFCCTYLTMTSTNNIKILKHHRSAVDKLSAHKIHHIFPSTGKWNFISIEFEVFTHQQCVVGYRSGPWHMSTLFQLCHSVNCQLYIISHVQLYDSRAYHLNKLYFQRTENRYK